MEGYGWKDMGRRIWVEGIWDVEAIERSHILLEDPVTMASLPSKGRAEAILVVVVRVFHVAMRADR